ncbi:MAG: hypothetical protein GTO24_13165 [candidate division Zixibacteria bacterium]|nr:hypothetical protein [candidate division Zixibacteria bacterium]
MVGFLDRFETVKVTGPIANRIWLPVHTKTGLRGFISSKYLAKGDGALAKELWCMENLGPRPKNGAIFIQKEMGDHALTIDNGRDQDAIVKLRNLSGKTVLSFYVWARNKVRIDSVPEGTYRVQFACGDSYSNRCGFFMEGMICLVFSDLTSFRTKSDNRYIYKSSIEYTLHRVIGGTVQAMPIDSQDFLGE